MGSLLLLLLALTNRKFLLAIFYNGSERQPENLIDFDTITDDSRKNERGAARDALNSFLRVCRSNGRRMLLGQFAV